MVDCDVYESENWLGTGKCKYSWECRGARLCERGGWGAGYDGCEGTPLPNQAPGLASDCLHGIPAHVAETPTVALPCHMPHDCDGNLTL